MTNPVALALVKLIVELRGRLALAGNWLICDDEEYSIKYAIYDTLMATNA